MNGSRDNLLHQLLVKPEGVKALANTELATLIAQARSSRLLAALGCQLRRVEVLETLEPRVQRHFDSAMVTFEKQRADLRYDVAKLRDSLAAINVPLVLLKGAAYICADLPVGEGRLITDIDMLVPKARLAEVETTLHASGWEGHEISAYDELYYRKYSHEIPALTHPKRDTTLDVHHNILPPTTGAKIDSGLLFEGLLEIQPQIYTLAYTDMVIHSATHLFHEGEFHHGLRDLWDLDQMLRDFPRRDPHFWEKVVGRSEQLDLSTSLFHGLTYVREIFATPVPKEIIEDASSWARTARRPLMDFLYLRAFRPTHPDAQLPLTQVALNMLYVRSHYLRMPLHVLIPHLARKAWMRHIETTTENDQL